MEINTTNDYKSRIWRSEARALRFLIHSMRKMRWCRCKKNNLHQLGNIDEINKLENCLRLKREELLRTDRELRHKQKQLIKLNCKAIKLQECKRKLSDLMVKYGRNKDNKKCEKKSIKKKKKKRSQNRWI